MVLKHRDETGAIAIIVALFSIAVMVLGALVVEVGSQREARTSAQSAADAAALAAAAAIYATPAPADRELAAYQAATTYAQKNWATDRPATDAYWNGCDVDYAITAQAGETWKRSAQSTCVAFLIEGGKYVKVQVVLPGQPTTQFFGAVKGDTRAMAQATIIQTVIQGEGLRPWAICSNVVTASETVTFVPTKGGSVANKDPKGAFPCGTDGPPGGWWVAQCTGQGNGTGDTENAVTSGCPTSGYHAVAGQLSTMTPTQLRTLLVGTCPSKTHNDTCLSSDPGNNFSLAKEEWQTLVGHTITMPIFCFPPQCAPGAAIDGSGNNASYAIKQVATVEVCGFKMGGVQSTGWPTAGPCKDNNPLNYSPADVITGDGLFLVIRKLEGGANPWAGNAPPPSLHLSR